MSPESGDGIRSARFRPSDRIWPESWIPAIWPDLAREPDPCRLAGSLPALSREAGSRPAGRTDLARSGQMAEIRPFVPESGSLCRNPAIPDSDETVRIPAFISNSGYNSRNQVKMVRILSVSDRISSSVIFILFYIYIYIF
jgi:hypothetical protein